MYFVGESVERTLALGVSIEVRDSGGSVLASDTQSTSATVTVAHPQETERVASIGVEGEIVD